MSDIEIALNLARQGDYPGGRLTPLLAEEIDRLRAELAEIKAALADPQAVHLNMLRGGIATPALRSLLHLYGQDALATYDRGATA